MEDVVGLEAAVVDTSSSEFLDRWQILVSTTNWEKGRIIHDWRDTLRGAGATMQQFSDEAWSRRVGNVSGQHVGRLRRVFEQFGAVRDTYPGLSWSHFCAALEWNDAEMWLEGAVQSGWSVSRMRQERWEAFGGNPADEPRDEQVVSAELDEDYSPAVVGRIGEVQPIASDGGGSDFVEATFNDGASNVNDDVATFDSDSSGIADSNETVVRPFENLPDLPADVTQAFEAYKLAILRHKLAGWVEISRADLVTSLESLKQLAMTPADL